MYFSYLQVCNHPVVTYACFTHWVRVLPLCCALEAVLLHYRKTESQSFILLCVSSKQDEFSALAFRKTHLRLVH